MRGGEGGGGGGGGFWPVRGSGFQVTFWGVGGCKDIKRGRVLQHVLGLLGGSWYLLSKLITYNPLLSPLVISTIRSTVIIGLLISAMNLGRQSLRLQASTTWTRIQARHVAQQLLQKMLYWPEHTDSAGICSKAAFCPCALRVYIRLVSRLGLLSLNPKPYKS